MSLLGQKRRFSDAHVTSALAPIAVHGKHRERLGDPLSLNQTYRDLRVEINSLTGLIVIDMNNLKFLNDKHGHHIGDEALKGLALEVKNKAGPDCVVTRIGGDEFGVVLPVS